MPRTYASSRDKLLDAAEAVLARDGLAGFNVESVSREAGVSKGGFFHHFRSKDALLSAVTERLVELMQRRLFDFEAADEAPRGRRLRAAVRASLDAPPIEVERMRTLLPALIASVFDGTVVADTARRSNEQMMRWLEKDRVAVGKLLVIQLALDGYWLGESFGTFVLDDKQKAAFRRTLLELLE